MKHFIKHICLTITLTVSLAFAHSYFESSVPENGAVLEEAPSEIIFNFEGNIQTAFSVFKVYALPEEMLADDGHHEGNDHSQEDTHSHDDNHGAFDTAASMFIPTVIDMQGDEDDRADAGLATSEALTKTVTIKLKENLAPGVYVAMFRALSADTHMIEGFITFKVHAHEE